MITYFNHPQLHLPLEYARTCMLNGRLDARKTRRVQTTLVWKNKNVIVRVLGLDMEGCHEVHQEQRYLVEKLWSLVWVRWRNDSAPITHSTVNTLQPK